MFAGIETARLRGEPLCEKHRGDFCRLLTDPRVMGDMGGARTPEQALSLFDFNLGHWSRFGFGLWAFFERESGRFAGRGGIRHFEIEGRDELELGYTLDHPFWQRGLATEMATGILDAAAGIDSLETVVAFTRPYNLASRRVIEKLGFTYEREFLHDAVPHVLYRIGLSRLRAGDRGTPRAGSSSVWLLRGAVTIQDLATCEANLASSLPLGTARHDAGQAFYLNASDPCRSLAVFEYGPGADPRGCHFHAVRQEFLFLISGSLRVTVWRRDEPGERAEAVLRPGQLLCVRPGVAHAYEALERSSAVEFSAALADAGDTSRA